ncbi:hypothetical protein L208DRAFT_1460329 [Tricholoma matsutake]|nr:hypothetical protein L208DRAFT_1460329 [Tricholoma matsutake 945]
MNWHMGHQVTPGPEKKKKKTPLNVEALPRESIKPITYELADGTSSDTGSRKEEKKDTAQRRSTPQGVHQANHPRTESRKKKTKAPLNVEALPRESIKPITYELADGTSDTRHPEKKKKRHWKETKAPLNIEALPRESIKPITYELADGTSSDTRSRKEEKKDTGKKKRKQRHRSTSKHSPGSPSSQSPMNWQYPTSLVSLLLPLLNYAVGINDGVQGPQLQLGKLGEITNVGYSHLVPSSQPRTVSHKALLNDPSHNLERERKLGELRRWVYNLKVPAGIKCT